MDEQIALLREREPPPDSLLADLGRRRVDATRERLVTVEGIPAARLTQIFERHHIERDSRPVGE